ncbi:2-hydroxyacid dehydrogenase [Methylobacterium sp. 1030]|uniref:2-hydroxyacid dehydrogenase n=1 Tax=Methylobacterium sp. 1030 TaxID=3156404 RepID=UPI003392A508
MAPSQLMGVARPKVLVLVFLTAEHRAILAEGFDVTYAPEAVAGADRSNCAAWLAAHCADVHVVLTNGTTGLRPGEIDAMPALELICTLGVGHENVALEHARGRGIPVANAAGTNDDCVADHALGILLAAVRRIPFLNEGVRHGLWRDDIPRPAQVSRRRLGIVGLGAIGRKIARRAAGFDMEIGYHGRRRLPDVDHPYFAAVTDLATWCDFLVVCAPGGRETHHLIGRDVLVALGPDGVLVNVARGSLVDTVALANALAAGSIAGAALDVYESEPNPPEPLLRFGNAILTPHVAGLSPQAMRASLDCFIDNVRRHLAGLPLRTPVG